MRIGLGLAALAILASGPAAAAAPLTIAEFLDKAEPMMRKSMAGLMFSSEAKRLMRHFGAAAEATRARQDEDHKAGRKPATCLPPKGKAKVEVRELIAFLRGLPPAERARSFQSGFAAYAARKYPC